MGTEIIAIIGFIVTVLGVVLTVVLTEDGRKLALRLLIFIKTTWAKWWSYTWVRLTILFVVEAIILLFLTLEEFIETSSATTMFILSLILFIGTVILMNQVNDAVKNNTNRISILEAQLSQLIHTKSLEKEMIQQGWSGFLRRLSTDISFTALSGLLEMTELYNIDNLNIVLIVPDALEHILEKLRPRIPDVEPILSSTYGKPYKLSVYTEQQIRNSNL